MCFLRKNHWAHALLCGILLALVVTSGCCNPFGKEHKSCNDITPGAIPQPNGTHACQWIHAQTARADQDKFVIYQYEWAADGVSLTQYGQDHVMQIARGLPQVSCSVVIEPVANPQVNDARRQTVFEALVNSGCQVGADRIVFGRSEAEGLYGKEAPGISSSMLGTQSGQRTSNSSSSQMGSQSSLGSSTGVNINVGSTSR
jgi:hypothetical protein